MNAERWQQIKALLQCALEREPNQRAAFLAEACAGDEALRKDVDSFICSYDQAGDFIEAPAFELMGESLTNLQGASIVGQSFGPYQILEHVGAGGMGDVYLAEDGRLGRKVAVKILPVAFTWDIERVRRFQQEARAASALNHPNILTIFEIGQIDSRHFIATEFIEGETLRQRMAKSQMEINEVLDVAVQVASALTAAHQAGIAHRDIKPENIMLRQDGFVKVVDFGIAKLTEPKTGESEAVTLLNTKQGTVIGTAHYMSPEQARGLQVDARTDVWSLGVVLYEMITGSVPFKGTTSSDVMASILDREPTTLARFCPEVPNELEWIMKKALRKNREERYQTIRELMTDLKSLVRKLQFEEELARSMDDPKSIGINTTEPPGTTGSTLGSAISRAPVSPGATQPVASSSAEYVVTGIKQHKLAAVIVIGLALGIVGLTAYLHARNTEMAIDSIAVLPFVNQNLDPNTEYLSDGLTESIINSLTRLPSLRVSPRSSVFQYKGKEIDPMKAARDLGVRAVLTGRMLQRGDNLLVSAELLDVRDNKQLWGEQYNRKLADALAVQQEISREISERLRTKLTSEEKKQLAKRYTDNAEAYQLYLKGRYYWNKRTWDGYQKATEQFEQAIDKDPSYALAYAGVADCYNVLPSYGMLPPREAFAKAREAVTRALEIDDKLAEAHTSLAYIRNWYDWDWSGAESEYQRAIELNPNYVTAHQWLALEMAQMGRMDEATREIKRAQDLDPLGLIVNINAGWIFYHARKYDRAIEEMRKSLELDPNFARGHWAISEPLEQLQKYDEAVAELQKARQLDETPIMLALLGHVYAVTGKRNEARKIIDGLNEQSKRMYVDPFFLAEIYVALDERDQALQALESAHAERSSWLGWLKVEPKFDQLRADPRFKELVRGVGLTP